jgi:hypothetical protein
VTNKDRKIWKISKKFADQPQLKSKYVQRKFQWPITLYIASMYIRILLGAWGHQTPNRENLPVGQKRDIYEAVWTGNHQTGSYRRFALATPPGDRCLGFKNLT